MPQEQDNHYLIDGLQQVRRGESYGGFEFIEDPLDRNKHERYLREIQMLNAIFPLPTDIPVFDEAVESDVDTQCELLGDKMNSRIAHFLGKEPDIQKLAEECTPYLRKRDREYCEQNGTTEAMKLVLGGTLVEGIRDMRSLVTTFRSMQEDKKSFDPQKILKSYPVAMWFASLHGKHEPDVMSHVGGSLSPVVLDKDYFEDNGGSYGIRSGKLDEYVEALDLPQTSTLKCVALYTTVLHGLWSSISDIYDKCDKANVDG